MWKHRELNTFKSEKIGIAWNERYANTVAGYLNKKGYIVIKIYNEIYRANRLAWAISYGTFPQYVIDHIDGNPSNNILKNLRDVNQLENTRNKICQNKLNERNIFISRNKYLVRVRAVGYSKSFYTLKEAIDVRNEIESMHGYIDRGRTRNETKEK